MASSNAILNTSELMEDVFPEIGFSIGDTTFTLGLLTEARYRLIGDTLEKVQTSAAEALEKTETRLKADLLKEVGDDKAEYDRRVKGIAVFSPDDAPEFTAAHFIETVYNMPGWDIDRIEKDIDYRLQQKIMMHTWTSVQEQISSAWGISKENPTDQSSPTV